MKFSQDSCSMFTLVCSVCVFKRECIQPFTESKQTIILKSYLLGYFFFHKDSSKTKDKLVFALKAVVSKETVGK